MSDDAPNVVALHSVDALGTYKRDVVKVLRSLLERAEAGEFISVAAAFERAERLARGRVRVVRGSLRDRAAARRPGRAVPWPWVPARRCGV